MTTVPKSKSGLPIPKSSPIGMDRAIEVFVRAFCFTRSLTHPYLAERIGPLWVMRDGPRTSGDYRNEEWIAHAVAPAEIDRTARSNARGRFAVCAFCGVDERDGPVRSAFKSLDYRLIRTEPFMIHHLRRIQRFESPAQIERVLTPDLADRLSKAARRRQIRPEHLTKDAPIRQYVASIGEELVGWVASIVVGDATWVSNMYVAEQFRRRGIGKALLGRLLSDDRAAGAKSTVLLASHTGAKLYGAVGYEQMGTLLIFTPVKR